MSHKAGHIAKIVLILSVIIGGLAILDFVSNSAIQNDDSAQVGDSIGGATEGMVAEIVLRQELLQLDAAIIMVASVFVIGSIFISRRAGRHSAG